MIRFRKVRRTAKGKLLIELNGPIVVNLAQMRDDNGQALGCQVETRALTHEVQIDVRDLDEMSSVEDISYAFKKHLDV